MYDSIRTNIIAQAIRTLADEMEVTLCGLYTQFSRAYGTAGTAPFASDATALNYLHQMLIDNGAPDTDLQLVINTAAGVNLRNRLSGLTNTIGQSVATDGSLIGLGGFNIRESGQVVAHTKGAGTGYPVNNGNGAIGSKTITFDGATVNTTGMKAGDVVQFNSAGSLYVVKTGTTATSGTFVLQNPGLVAATANDQAVAIGNSYAANLAFHKNAIALLTRLPKRPIEGDMASDVMVIADPNTGINYEFAMYKQYRQVRFEVSAAWGAKVTNPDYAHVLMG